MTPELAALTQRVEDLEKQVAHLAALAVEHSDTDQTLAARTVNAQTFIVTDARVVRRAELSMSIPRGRTEENAWLKLFDADGNVRACRGVEGEVLPWLEFYDASQKSVVNVVADEHGPRIGLFNGDTKPGVSVALSEAGPRIPVRRQGEARSTVGGIEARSQHISGRRERKTGRGRLRRPGTRFVGQAERRQR